MIAGAVIGLAFAAQAADIVALVKEDQKHEVRLGGVNGSPFWDANARFFMYPPTFDFPSDRLACARVGDADPHLSRKKG